MCPFESHKVISRIVLWTLGLCILPQKNTMFFKNMSFKDPYSWYHKACRIQRCIAIVSLPCSTTKPTPTPSITQVAPWFSVDSSSCWVEGGGGMQRRRVKTSLWVVSWSQLSQAQSLRLRAIGFYLHLKMKDSIVSSIYHTWHLAPAGIIYLRVQNW